MNTARAWLSIFHIKVAEGFQYRMATLSGCINVVVFILVKIVMLRAFYTYGTNPAAAGSAELSLEQAITYQWLAHSLWPMLAMGVDGSILRLITSGDVGIELCRPISLYALWYARTAAGKVAPMVTTCAFVWLAALALSPFGLGMQGPASLQGFLLALVALGAAFFLCASFAMVMTAVRVNLTWGEGPVYMLAMLSGILSGGYMPLQLWPDAMQKFLLWQPFSGCLDIPFRLYLGSVAPGQALQLIGLQLLWGAGFVLLGRWILKARLGKLIVQGG